MNGLYEKYFDEVVAPSVNREQKLKNRGLSGLSQFERYKDSLGLPDFSALHNSQMPAILSPEGLNLPVTHFQSNVFYTCRETDPYFDTLVSPRDSYRKGILLGVMKNNRLIVAGILKGRYFTPPSSGNPIFLSWCTIQGNHGHGTLFGGLYEVEADLESQIRDGFNKQVLTLCQDKWPLFLLPELKLSPNRFTVRATRERTIEYYERISREQRLIESDSTAHTQIISN